MIEIKPRSNTYIWRECGGSRDRNTRHSRVGGSSSQSFEYGFKAASQTTRPGEGCMTYGIQHPKSRSKWLQAYPCEPCGKETPFQNQQCLYCGAVLSIPLIDAAREKKDARKAMSYFDRVTAGAIKGRQKSIARRDYWKRMAEESRKKWESK